MPADVWFRLLGPVALTIDGEHRDLGSAKQRCLLAILLIESPTPVPVDVLVDRLWSDTPPDCARNALHSYVARLRSVLRAAGAAVQRRSGGYTLDIGDARVDMRQIVTLLERGGDRAGRLSAALDLWLGEPLAGLTGAWPETIRAGLRRKRLGLLTEWAGLLLAASRPAEVVLRLRPEMDTFPLAEKLIARYLRALCDIGRPAEALERYDDLVRRLAEELGAEPGPALKAVHQTLTATRPAQLPPAPTGFLGRDQQLADLDELTNAGIVVVTGTPGTGKTALVLAWAHRVRGRFPGGQLHVDLRGAAGDPVRPGAALAGFLDALGIAPDQIPRDDREAANLYRSVLATRRMLVVLDDAGDAAQVRPLLPGSDGSVVVVTSRQRLTGLVVGEGARKLALRDRS